MAAGVDRVDAYRSLADAVLAHDARKARSRAEALLKPATTALLDALAAAQR